MYGPRAPLRRSATEPRIEIPAELSASSHGVAGIRSLLPWARQEPDNNPTTEGSLFFLGEGESGTRGGLPPSWLIKE